MNGKYGTSMQGIEHRIRRGNRECKNCIHLKYGIIGRKAGYKCEIKNKEMYYTSKLYCKNFKEK